MPVLGIPKSGLPLGGSLSSAKPGGVHPEVFSLSLTDSVIEDMIKCVRNGKSIELSLGNDPVSFAISQ
jgi:RNA polymerase II elongation factor ELL